MKSQMTIATRFVLSSSLSLVLIGILMAVSNASGYAKGMDDGAEAAMDAVRKHFILSPKMRELVDL